MDRKPGDHVYADRLVQHRVGAAAMSRADICWDCRAPMFDGCCPNCDDEAGEVFPAVHAQRGSHNDPDHRVECLFEDEEDDDVYDGLEPNNFYNDQAHANAAPHGHN